MAFEAILDEVDQLHNVSTRLEGLAEQHPPVEEALMTIAGNVRSTATVLAVLVATKLRSGDGNTFSTSAWPRATRVRHATAWGLLRRELVAECHLVEHIISATLQDNFLRIEMSTLIRNMIGIDESLNAYSEEGARPCRVAPQGMIGDSRIT
jgi:hypothetical protein